jgi:regulator of replication initiation timing
MKRKLKWLRSHCWFVTKHDLNEMEERLSMKISELKNEVTGMKAQVTKIWDEQQKRFDELTTAFEALKATLGDAELDAETLAEIDSFKALLTAFDDTIPDTTA